MKDFYYILGTDVNCTSTEIREAYRKLSKKFHPDLNQNDKYFESQFKEIQQAYEILIDPVKRIKYDIELIEFQSIPINSKPQKQYSKTTFIDIGFTLVLVLTTILFGTYVAKVMTHSKTEDTISKTIPVSPVAVNTLKHRRKKHYLKVPAITDALGRDNKLKIETNSSTFQNKAVMAKIKFVADSAIKPTQKKSYLYTSYLQSNITGVVNMRQSDKLNSEIIKQVPTNSQVFVIERGNSFYKIKFNNEVGYVPKWTLQSR